MVTVLKRHSTGRLHRTCNFVGRATFEGIDHDQQLHDGVIDLGTARLNDKDILFTDARQDPNTCFALFDKALVLVASSWQGGCNKAACAAPSTSPIWRAREELRGSSHWRTGSALRRLGACPGSHRFAM